MSFSPNTFDLIIWNVEHGLSCTILTPFVNYVGGVPLMRRRWIQFDAGYNSVTNFSPLKHMYHQGHKQIDCLIVSHPDDDHINDLPNLYSDHVVHTFCCNWTFPSSEISENQAIELAPKKRFRQYHGGYRNFNLPSWQVLTPLNFGGVESFSTSLPHMPGYERNDSSLITSIVYKNTQILFTGDISADSFQELYNQGKLPAARTDCYRFLVASHHGRLSAEPTFTLNYFKPHLVFASAADFDQKTTSIYSTEKVGGYFINNDFENKRKFVTTKGAKGIHLSQDLMDQYPTIRTFSN